MTEQLQVRSARTNATVPYEVMTEILGEVCGVVFSHPDEKTIYVAADTIWNDDVAAVLYAHAPEIAILNAGYAMVQGIVVLSRFGSGLFRAMLAMKEIENGNEIHRRVSP